MDEYQYLCKGAGVSFWYSEQKEDITFQYEDDSIGD